MAYTIIRNSAGLSTMCLTLLCRAESVDSPFIAVDNVLTIDYDFRMYTIKLLPEFKAWIDGIKDGMTHRRLATRLRKATLGNLGDVKPVGEGVLEMREHFGPGWRMYCVKRGSVLIVMLGGGE